MGASSEQIPCLVGPVAQVVAQAPGLAAAVGHVVDLNHPVPLHQEEDGGAGQIRILRRAGGEPPAGVVVHQPTGPVGLGHLPVLIAELKLRVGGMQFLQGGAHPDPPGSEAAGLDHGDGADGRGGGLLSRPHIPGPQVGEKGHPEQTPVAPLLDGHPEPAQVFVHHRLPLDVPEDIGVPLGPGVLIKIQADGPGLVGIAAVPQRQGEGELELLPVPVEGVPKLPDLPAGEPVIPGGDRLLSP